MLKLLFPELDNATEKFLILCIDLLNYKTFIFLWGSTVVNK